MNLRDYMSNNEELNQFIKKQEESEVEEHAKILGLCWNTRTDELALKLPQVTYDESIIWTKRKVLQKVASVHDPFGWVTPVTLVGKMFIQKLWTEKITWDEVLPEDCHEEWITIIKSWTTSSIKFPRLFLSKGDSDKKYDIHIFTDASQGAYAAVSYLVEMNGKQPTRTSLLVTKSRLTPTKLTMTIPKLELAAVVIGAKLLHYLREELGIQLHRQFIWTDSKVALSWTQSEKNLPVFIRNRVRTIKRLVPEATILHVPGTLNPADIASRGCTIEHLKKHKMWWDGPEFLLREESEWPQDRNEINQEIQFVTFTTPEQRPQFLSVIQSHTPGPRTWMKDPGVTQYLEEIHIKNENYVLQ
ncbi:unnamed protein product [Heligmosomoides polygyrus]|uniref:Integrase catalytic domain-containing protein n=1 Tax=Heligmosomoides polygyrus TaxID=6339 RepID=A0A183GPL2_HELPZ|nr:unnamed protein product [Heligmosomoides polygyrus]